VPIKNLQAVILLSIFQQHGLFHILKRSKSVRANALKWKVTSGAHTDCSCCSDFDIREIPSSKKAKILRNLQL